MLRLASRTFARMVLCALVLAFMPSAIAAPVAAEGEAASISPWEIEAVYKNDRFDRCAISRNLDDDISVTFVRSGAGLSLLLASPHWELEPGKDYPVTLKLGPQSWNREVGAEANSVSMAVEDAKFVSGLRAANALDVVAAGDTIHVPLKGSATAFERLDRCFEKNERWLTSEPACSNVAGAMDSEACSVGVEAETEGSPVKDAIASSEESGPPPPAKPAVEVKTEENPAEDAIAASEEEGPPPPAAKPAVEVKTEEKPAEDTIATSEEEVPPSPAAKPAVEVKTEEKPAEDAIATSEEEVPPSPAAKPAAESETEGASATDAVASSEEESAPPAAKPEKAPVEPAAKKASQKKKRTTQPSAQSAKRAFKREVDRLRRFFGN